MTSEITPPVRPPHLLWSLTDGYRATGELAWFASTKPWFARNGARGDGRPVLVLPGLMAGDWSTAPLRRLLDQHGYVTYGWGMGTNTGPTVDAVDGLDALFREIRERHGRPMSLIGQSLGGLFARDLARRYPGDVDRIITLGSPVSIADSDQSRAKQIYEYVARNHHPDFTFDKWILAPHPDVPSTSIYSRIDGICRWETCLLPRSPLTENIEVVSSHLGMAVQPPAVYATLDRLAAPLDDWQPFRPPFALRACYRGLRNRVHAAA